MMKETSTFSSLEPQITVSRPHTRRPPHGWGHWLVRYYSQVLLTHRCGHPPLQLPGGKHVKGAAPFLDIFKDSYGLGLALLPLKTA